MGRLSKAEHSEPMTGGLLLGWDKRHRRAGLELWMFIVIEKSTVFDIICTMHESVCLILP